MHTTKKINVSDAFHEKISGEANRLKMSKKEYLETATEFFIARKIDPRQYVPGQNNELMLSLLETVNTILDFLESEKKSILNAVFHETLKSRILTEIAINNLLSLSDLNEGEFSKLREGNDEYFSDKLQKVLEYYEYQKTKSNS